MTIFNMMNKQRSNKEGKPKGTSRILLYIIGIIFLRLLYNFHWFLFNFHFLCLLISIILTSLTSFKALPDSSPSLPLKRIPTLSFNIFYSIPSS